MTWRDAVTAFNNYQTGPFNPQVLAALKSATDWVHHLGQSNDDKAAEIADLRARVALLDAQKE